MSRVATTSTEEKVVKKTPRKRATATKAATPKVAKPRKAAVRTSPAKKTATEKKPARKPRAKKVDLAEEVLADDQELDEVDLTEEADVTETEDTAAPRKAPTKFASIDAAKRARRTQIIVIGLLMSIGVGASAAVAMSDPTAGQINVAQTIKERNERMQNLVDVDGPVVIAPTPSALPDGGFIGLRPADPAPVVPSESASTTATSTDVSNTDTDTDTENEAATATDSAQGQTQVSESTADPVNNFASDTATTTVDAVNRDQAE